MDSIFSKRNVIWLAFLLIGLACTFYMLDGDIRGPSKPCTSSQTEVVASAPRSPPQEQVSPHLESQAQKSFPLVFSTDWKTSVISKYGFRMGDSEIDEEMEPTVGEGIQPEDPKLLENIRKYFLDPPSPYITKFSYPMYETPVATAVDNILKKKKNGFFVECGANDGERSSNTIFLETKRAWKGLLIEMDPAFYLQILGKNRKSHSMNACISIHNYPSKMKFQEHSGGLGKLVSDTKTGSLIRTAYCFPFYSIMLAMNITKIDYFSLDVEGAELDILKTIPYDKLDISVISAEWVHGAGGEKSYVDFMVSKGYRKHSKIHKVDKKISLFVEDIVFVKESLL